MKQIALGIHQYASDNDGKLMPYVNVDDYGDLTSLVNHFDPVQPYLKSSQILFCPSAPKFKPSSVNLGAIKSSKYSNTHYGLPMNHTGNQNFIAPLTKALGIVPPVWPLDVFTEPSIACLLGETQADNASQAATGWGASYFGATTQFGFYYKSKDRHLEGANYAYIDGHVKWISETEADRVRTDQGSNIGIAAADASKYPIVFAWKR